MEVEITQKANFPSESFLWSSHRGNEWRGYGGIRPTMKTVDFDQQLDKIAIWLEQWDHNQVTTLY